MQAALHLQEFPIRTACFLLGRSERFLARKIFKLPKTRGGHSTATEIAAVLITRLMRKEAGEIFKFIVAIIVKKKMNHVDVKREALVKLQQTFFVSERNRSHEWYL